MYYTVHATLESCCPERYPNFQHGVPQCTVHFSTSTRDIYPSLNCPLLYTPVHTSGPAVDQPRGECERRGQGDGDPPAPGGQVSEDQQKLLLCQLLSNSSYMIVSSNIRHGVRHKNFHPFPQSSFVLSTQATPPPLQIIYIFFYILFLV